MGHSTSLSTSGERQFPTFFTSRWQQERWSKGWFLQFMMKKSQRTLVALWANLAFHTPNKFVQVCSITATSFLTNSVACCVKHAGEMDGAEEFWVTPAVMRHPSAWLLKESMNIYKAWSSHDMDWCCWIPRWKRASEYTGMLQHHGNVIFVICGETQETVLIPATND